MQPITRVRRKRPRFALLPGRSLLGIAWIVLESAVLLGSLALAGTELLVREREASFSGDEIRVFTGVQTADEPIDGLNGATLTAQLSARSSAWLDAPMRLVGAGQTFQTTPRELGAQQDPRQSVAEALAWGRGPSLIGRVQERLASRTQGVEIPLRARMDPVRSRDVLEGLAPALTRKATPGRVDLRNRRFLPPTPARGLLVEETIPRVALAMAQGHDRVDLATYAMVPPERAAISPVFPDISTIVGQAKLPIPADCPGQAERAANRAQAIAALDGTVVEPQGRISLWGAIGEPLRDRGFRAAQSCPSNAEPAREDRGLNTLASTVFTAAFFAGMDLLQVHLPDDRVPGAELGLDAKLRWPSEDLELGNPHEVPLVLHVREDQGSLVAQWLGASRPFKVAFEREILATQRFETATRPDPQALLGSQRALRQGRPGYRVLRRRILSRPGAPDQRSEDRLKYPPRSAVTSVGEDPLGPPPQPGAKEPQPVAPEDPKVRIVQ